MPKSVNRGRALAILQQVNSTIGAPVLKLGNDEYFNIIRIPSGSLVIDRITGGGFALGRHLELFGDESVCKSWIAYKTMALAQQRGKVCALIDPEHTFEPSWFRSLGGRPEELITAQPEIAEEAIEAMMLLFQNPDMEVITVDSVAALATKEEIQKAPNAEKEVRIASQARFMSLNLRRLTTLNKHTLVLWTNQNRTKIGQFFGNPTSQPGGRALKFYDTARIELKRGEGVKQKGKKVNTKSKVVDSDNQTGFWVYAKAMKNKASKPYMEGTFLFDNEAGEIDEISEIIQLGLIDGLIEQKGKTNYSYVDLDDVEWTENSLKKFRQLLSESDTIREELIDSIRENTLELAVPRSSFSNGHNHSDDEE
jgi:recombination protein RecA